MSESPPSLARVMNFINSLHQQCRDVIRDTIRLLRDDHQICLAHTNAWDYCIKPNDRFLEQSCSVVQRCWSTFIPTEDNGRGVLFDIEFCRVNQLLTPALLYGAVDPGAAGFGAVSRWASYNTTHYAELGTANLVISHKGPIAVLAGRMPDYFEEANLVRVPLESIVDQDALRRIVVTPLALLLHGKHEEVLASLQGVTTETWPCKPINVPEVESDEPELP